MCNGSYWRIIPKTNHSEGFYQGTIVFNGFQLGEYLLRIAANDKVYGKESPNNKINIKTINIIMKKNDNIINHKKVQLIIVLFCLLISNNAFSKLINVGTEYLDFEYNNVTYNSTPDTYSITITQAMRLTISVDMRSKDASEASLELDDDNYEINYAEPYTQNTDYGYLVTLKTGLLPPGTYTISSPNLGSIEVFLISIKGVKRSLFTDSIILGDFDKDFVASDTQNTINFWNDYGSYGNDVYYQFTLSRAMNIDIFHCDSEVTSTNLYLLDSLGRRIAFNDNYSGEEQCSSTTNAYLKMGKLLPGTYSVISEGDSEEGNISTTVVGRIPQGDTFDKSISLGTFSDTFSCIDTKNTSDFVNDYGLATNDVYYKFTLNRSMDVSISHCGSEVTDTYLYLLDSTGKLITSNDNYSGDGQCSSVTNAYLKATDLAAGSYYIVSEGNTMNGNITTTVNGTIPLAGFETGQNQNYIIEITPTVESSDARNLTLNQCIQKIQYYDGLGRLSQTVQRGFSLNNNDLVILQEYDDLGRESNVWLPTPYSGNGSYTDPDIIKSKAITATVYNDSFPFSTPVYEASPLNRVLQKYGPGVNWRTAGASVKSAFYTNNKDLDSLKCAYYYVTSDNKLVKSDDDYDNGQLYVTRSMDEDGHEVFEFKDKQGEVILTRQKNGGEYYDTYYVYDDFGNKCFVLPPSAAAGLSSNTYTGAEELLRNFAYIYQYDSRNRCIYKKLPGTDPIYMVYDKADHLIFSQDGEQRSKMPKEWTFSIPDVFNRTILTGICTDTVSVKNIVLNGSFVNESNGFMNTGYQLSNQINAYTRLLTVNYYDNYNYKSLLTDTIKSKLEYAALDGYAKKYVNAIPEISAKGLLTGTRVFMLEEPAKEIITAMYYDNRGRLAQSKATNHLGGDEKDYFLYTFTGKIKKHQHIHSASGKATITEVYENFYDNAEKLTKTTHSLNGLAPVTLAENTYDNIGRLSSKSQHVAAGATNSVETTSYTYNIKSWLKSINTAKSRFSETLYYDESYNGSLKYYNGNISAMNWKVQNENYQRSYSFHYDDLSRITKAYYQDDESNSQRNYSTFYEYDNMGNIKNLKRNGLANNNPYSWKLIDNLTLNYNGNQLSSVTDAPEYEPSYFGAFNFVKANAGTPEYTYDTNGNLTRDSHKKIAKIQYNILNLPSKLQFTQGHTTEYLYDAAGVKRRVKQITAVPDMFVSMGTIRPVSNDSIKEITQTDYCENVIYENGALSKIFVDGGYITMSGTTPTYHYYIQDHQGNNRVVFNQNGTTEQTNHYYPSGMTFGECIDNSDNRYKYNGKELDRMHGLDLYDYGARHYDAAIGRWGVVDQLAEKKPWLSPYVYCRDNPLNIIDPDGRDEYLLIWATANGEFGHSALAVANYNDKHEPTGTYTFYELGPGKGASLGLSHFNQNVNAHYSTDNPNNQNVRLSELMTNVKDKTSLSVYENRSADGIVQIKTNYRQDYYAKNALENWQNKNPSYNGVTNNCTVYAVVGVSAASGKVIDTREVIKTDGHEVKTYTPNYLYNGVSKMPNTKVIKNPGNTVNNSFLQGRAGVFEKFITKYW